MEVKTLAMIVYGFLGFGVIVAPVAGLVFALGLSQSSRSKGGVVNGK